MWWIYRNKFNKAPFKSLYVDETFYLPNLFTLLLLKVCCRNLILLLRDKDWRIKGLQTHYRLTNSNDLEYSTLFNPTHSYFSGLCKWSEIAELASLNHYHPVLTESVIMTPICIRRLHPRSIDKPEIKSQEPSPTHSSQALNPKLGRTFVTVTRNLRANLANLSSVQDLSFSSKLLNSLYGQIFINNFTDLLASTGSPGSHSVRLSVRPSVIKLNSSLCRSGKYFVLFILTIFSLFNRH